MFRIGVLDQAARQREKQRARDRDAEDLRSGRVSQDELARHNGFFSAFDLSKARILAIGAREIARYKAKNDGRTEAGSSAEPRGS